MHLKLHSRAADEATEWSLQQQQRDVQKGHCSFSTALRAAAGRWSCARQWVQLPEHDPGKVHQLSHTVWLPMQYGQSFGMALALLLSVQRVSDCLPKVTAGGKDWAL